MSLIEVWKDVKNYEGLYQVSNLGRIRTLRVYRIAENRHEKTIRVLRLNTRRQGYKTITLSKGDSRKTFLVHRLVAQSFIENKNNKPEVNHKDADKSNNRVSNLEWVTAKENSLHATRLKIKSTENAVSTIKRRVYLYDNGDLIKEYASGMQCARELNLNYKSLNSALNRGYRYKGLDVRY